jgi:CDP-glucose 4,6-dehydratase
MDMAASNFWFNKRVFLTGHTGFKGSWLCLWLQSLGAKVRGMALPPPTEPALFNVARVYEGMEHQIGDIRNYDTVKSAIDDFKPEIVIHMAAQPLVLHSYAYPIDTYATNVMGTVHLLEAARQSDSVKVILNVTTDKCYENREWVWGYREDEPMGGRDPYSNSKGCAELVSSCYRSSYLTSAGIAIATARAGNVVGGGDWARSRLIPDALCSLQEDRPIIVRNPYAIRPWQHVLEPLSGYLLLAERLFTSGQLFSGGWNFGPYDVEHRSVRWIVERLCADWGHGASWTFKFEDSPYEASVLKLDISKAQQLLKWTPRWTLEKALKIVTKWHRSWISGENMRNVCLNQISEYQNQIK